MGRKIFSLLLLFLGYLCVNFLNVAPAHAVIYVGNSAGDNIPTWPNNTTGNIMPSTNIVGAATTFNGPVAVAVDANWIYVANTLNNTIDVFPIGATGNEVPTRSIQGATTTLNFPAGVAVSDVVIVPTMTEWGIMIFVMLLGFISIYYLRRQRAAI